MEKILVSNQKMSFDKLKDVEEYISKMKDYKDKFIVAPSNLYLKAFADSGFTCSGQNVYSQNKGAFTGQTSASAIKDLGAKYTLIGHSETRSYLKEDEELINEKVKNALETGLTVFLCIGESLKTKEEGKTKEFLKKQLDVNLKDVEDLSNLYISYEPIWSIGSTPPSNEEIEDIVKYIKSLFKEDVRVLYGGGVNEKNIEELNKIPNINGYLIGGASTIPEKFIKIIEVTK